MDLQSPIQAGLLFSPEEYYVSPGSLSKGCYSIHINALFDIGRHIYTDAVIQPVHHKDEFRAFYSMVDRHPVTPGTKNVYIGDRGYCSYNNMTHVIEKGQYFLFRTKDIHSKGLVGNFDFLGYGSQDIYELSFRVVRFPISENNYECIVTNLPKEGFPPERLKKLYFSRWGIESSFRKLNIQLV